MKFQVCLLVIACTVFSAQSSSILMYMPAGSKSHWNAWRPLAVALAKRGHSLTVFTPNKDPVFDGMKNVDLHVTGLALDSIMSSKEIFEGKLYFDIQKLMSFLLETQNTTFHHPGFQKIYNEKPKFDLAIVHVFNLDFGFYFAKEVLNTPSMILFPGSRFPWADFFMGNPLDPSYIPFESLPYSQEMSFFQRVINFAATHAFARTSWYLFPKLENHAQQLTNGEYQVDLNKAAMDMDFCLANGHPIFDGVRPINPNMEFVGGLHLNDPKPLPKDIKEWIDGAKDGVIYAAFGSILSGSQMPERIRQMFINVFSSLKQRVIFKWETEEMEGKPENVLLKKWCPQQDILAHPNVKLFITHGGLLGTEESLRSHVPMLCIPGFADQPGNANIAERLGYGLKLDWATLTEEDLRQSITALLTDPKFKDNARHYGQLFTDNIVPPIEKAVYHVEHLIRHKGAQHLKPAHLHLNWLQYHSVDVVAFLTMLPIVIFTIFFKLTVACCSFKSQKVKQLLLIMMKNQLITLVFLGVILGTHAGSIFMYMSIGSKSHWNVWRPLALALAKRGHTLTIFAPNKDPKFDGMPNVELHTTGLSMDSILNSEAIFEGKASLNFNDFLQFQLESQNTTFHHPGFQKIYNEKPKFDLAIVHVFNIDFGFYFAKEVLNTPSMILFPGSRFKWAEYFMGNPLDPSYIPIEFSTYSQDMTFFQRVMNFVGTQAFARSSWYVFPKLEKQAQELTNGKYQVDISKAAMDMDYCLTNGHPIFDGVRPTNPNMEVVGGLHLNDPKPLPKDIKEWIDGAKDGVIYVSFGSVLSGSKMPERIRQMFINVFSSLKQRVIFKWETEEMEGKPENVLLKNWCPQQDILAHPNVKLFITHGGLLGTEESLRSHVPMLYIPGFADQPGNANVAERLGYGLKLDWATLTEEDLRQSITALLTDPKFKDNARHYGQLFTDNIVPPIEKAVYHVEHLIRHKGAQHLKPAHLHLNWLQYHSVDVVAFLIMVPIVIFTIFFKLIVACCCSKRQKIKLS
ncbi:uncharacterized protein LOC131884964 [Tigriopus californicus]|uniref:uncharacterized protein LOC131884964 n=1 Tax=Tigriopus californicus TaxID=6832 RepID=UPI0027DAB3FE|nr:uncharacterized protein LOC131884964 [Tigriopus californicus]